MKPCPENRRPIAWLAIAAGDGAPARALRAHLERCDGCRAYFAELSRVAAGLRAAEAGEGPRASEAFHRRVTAALRDRESGRLAAGARLRALWSWRLKWPAVAAAVCVAAVVVISLPSRVARPQAVNVAPEKAVPEKAVPDDLSPTASNYEMAARQSLDKLDDLITRQAFREEAPSTIYTAGSLARGLASD